jgi:hypothetical protein
VLKLFSLHALDVLVANLKYGQTWQIIACGYGWLAFNVLVHEIGHAAVSIAFGRRPLAIKLGAGLVLARVKGPRRWIGHWELALPVPVGHARFADSAMLTPGRSWLRTAAGPTANLVLAGLMAAVFAHAPSPTAYLCFWISFISFADGFLPIFSSDGRKLWKGAVVAGWSWVRG